MVKFQVNPKAPFDNYHTRQGQFRKGVIYDSDELRLRPEQIEYLRGLKLKELPVFEMLDRI